MRLRVGLATVTVIATLLFGACLVPLAAGVLHSGRVADLSPRELMSGSGRVVVGGRWRDPARAYPWPGRRDLPSAPGFAVSAVVYTFVVGSAAIAVGRRLEVRASRARLGRVWFEVGGRSPRSWARPRDLRALWVRRPTRGRLTLGTVGRCRRLLAAEPETHVAVIAPTGSGKSSRFIIPWLLEAEGPAVVCSTKLDVTRNINKKPIISTKNQVAFVLLFPSLFYF